MVKYFFTNVFNTSDVYIIGSITNHKRIKLPNNPYGYCIDINTDGIYTFKYIVNNVETICKSKLHIIDTNDNICNYIIIKDGMLSKNYIMRSIEIGDSEVVYNVLQSISEIAKNTSAHPLIDALSHTFSHKIGIELVASCCGQEPKRVIRSSHVEKSIDDFIG